MRSNCACYCKDTHFEAIHNPLRIGYQGPRIVLATAKIHILKQFTTRIPRHGYRTYCACYCKDTHFEAIHNALSCTSVSYFIVLATAKIHILKQFTTLKFFVILRIILCLLLQRYTFWSNSQRCFWCWHDCFYCACYCKDTHFEAIHNLYDKKTIKVLLCLLLQRYTFWSNSQRRGSF